MSSLLTNIISYWKLDGNSIDSNSGYNGSDTDITYSLANGKINQGAGFNGSTSNISIANQTALNFVGTAFSTSFWIYSASFPASPNFKELVNKSQVSTNNGWSVDAHSGHLRAIGSTNYDIAFSFSNSTWYHIVFTFDGSATGKFYVNGTLQGSGGTYHNNNAWTGALKIGCDSDGTGGLWSGNMDEIGIWSRALTQAEVTQLYNGGAGLQYSFYPDLFWIGGTGNWNDSAHWANTSGGTTVGLFPDQTVNATYDASSGAGTSTINVSSACNSLTCTNYTQTLAGSSALAVYGNLALGSSMTLSYTGTITFASIATGKTITSSGKSFSSALVFDGIGGGWTLQDDLICKTLALTNGTLAGSSFMITLTSTGTVLSRTSGLFTPGTSTIKLTDASSSSKTFSGGGLTYYNLWITGAGTGAYTISGSNTFNDFKCDTPPHTINFTAGTTQTIGSFTVNGNSGGGKINQGAAFNGNTSLVTIGAKSNLNVASFTISGWVWIDSSQADWGSIFNNLAISPNIDGYDMEIRPTLGIRVIIGNNAGTYLDSADGTLFTDNSWHHVAITFNQPTVNFYVDSNLTKTVNWNFAISYAETPSAIIGYRSAYVKGNIDELGIWSRAISQTEITNLYNHGAGLALASFGSIATNLVSYYKFDGNSNDSVDSNNGTDTDISYNATNLMTLQSTSVGSPWHLLKTPDANVSCDYLALQDSHVSEI